MDYKYINPQRAESVLFGYSIRTKGNKTNTDTLTEKREEISSYLKKVGTINLVLVHPWWEYRYDIYTGEEIVPELFERGNLENVFRTEFCHVATKEANGQIRFLANLGRIGKNKAESLQRRKFTVFHENRDPEGEVTSTQREE